MSLKYLSQCLPYPVHELWRLLGRCKTAMVTRHILAIRRPLSETTLRFLHRFVPFWMSPCNFLIACCDSFCLCDRTDWASSWPPVLGLNNNNKKFILRRKMQKQTQRRRSLHIAKTYDHHLEACCGGFPPARQRTILNSHRVLGIATNTSMVLNYALVTYIMMTADVGLPHAV